MRSAPKWTVPIGQAKTRAMGWLWGGVASDAAWAAYLSLCSPPARALSFHPTTAARQTPLWRSRFATPRFTDITGIKGNACASPATRAAIAATNPQRASGGGSAHAQKSIPSARFQRIQCVQRVQIALYCPPRQCPRSVTPQRHRWRGDHGSRPQPSQPKQPQPPRHVGAVGIAGHRRGCARSVVERVFCRGRAQCTHAVSQRNGANRRGLWHVAAPATRHLPTQGHCA